MDKVYMAIAWFIIWNGVIITSYLAASFIVLDFIPISWIVVRILFVFEVFFAIFIGSREQNDSHP